MRTADEFMKACVDRLSVPLSDLGYTYMATYTRPLGIAVEYSNGNNLFFTVLEGEILAFDLILKIDVNVFYRVDLNQALWWNGIRYLTDKSLTIHELLNKFSHELSLSLSDIFTGNDLTKDARYWFHISPTEHENYLNFQRGN